MCFSAGASFGASVIIGAISVACFAKAATPAAKVWACIPLFFSVQQAIEGFLWLSLTHTALRHLYGSGVYGFILFAEVIWPAMIPITAYMPEPEGKRKKILKLFLYAGAAVSVFHLYCLMSYQVEAVATAHHIAYEEYYPKILLRISKSIYFIPTIIPLFISSRKRIRWFGLALIVSYMISHAFYRNNVISVWCYLSALLSGIVLLIIMSLNESKQ